MKQEITLRQGKTIDTCGEPEELVVYGGLHYIRGNKTPYFSCTASSYRVRYGYRSEGSIGGCHEEILRTYPELKPIVDLRLSDILGEPMYAVENGMHWFSVASGIPNLKGRWGPDQSQEKCAEIFMSHVRIGQAEFDDLCRQARQVWESVSHYQRVYEEGGRTAVRSFFVDWIDSQRLRWWNEASAAVISLGLEVYPSEVKSPFKWIEGNGEASKRLAKLLGRARSPDVPTTH